MPEFGTFYFTTGLNFLKVNAMKKKMSKYSTLRDTKYS